MRLERLELWGFRNYETLTADFDPGVNLILGDNAQGKTNLLEAMVYLGTGKSFRTRKEQELIRFGAEFAELRAKVEDNARELMGVLNTVLFCPEDLLILKTGASARRKFLDGALGPLRPNYDRALTEYGRLLDQKSRILKDRFDFPQYLEVLPEYSQRMCQVGALLISYRARFLKSLGEEAQRYHREFTGGKETLDIGYKTVSNIEDPFVPVEELTELLSRHMESHKKAELETGQCLSGPHKDDFDVSLDGISLKSFGSQGQVRTAAISLKLAQRELYRREFGEEPVLLLDDVLSELDARRQDFVLNELGSGQVFITCCEKGRLTRAGKTIEIADGHIV